MFDRHLEKAWPLDLCVLFVVLAIAADYGTFKFWQFLATHPHPQSGAHFGFSVAIVCSLVISFLAFLFLRAWAKVAIQKFHTLTGW